MSGGSIDARFNYWGDSNGPPENIRGETGSNSIISWDRWCLDEECNQLSEGNIQGSSEEYTTLQGALDAVESDINIQDEEINEGSLEIPGRTYEITSNGEGLITSDSSDPTIDGSIRSNLYLEDLAIDNSGSGPAIDFPGHINTNPTIEMTNIDAMSDIRLDTSSTDANIEESIIYEEVTGSINVQDNWWQTTDEEEIDSRTDSTFEPYCLDKDCDDKSS